MESPSPPPETRIWPLLFVLPIGFGWGVYWAGLAHRTLLARPGLESADQCELVDRRPVSSLSAHAPLRLVYIYIYIYIYIGNGLFTPRSKHRAKQARQIAHTALTNDGLPMHEKQGDQSTVECVGLGLQGLQDLVRTQRVKRWRLRVATRAFLRRRVVTGRQLEVLAGHWTSQMVLHRCTFACFSGVYAYVRTKYLVPSSLWPSARRELIMALGFQPLMSANMRLQPNLSVLRPGACESGVACHVGVCSPSFVSHALRHSDRWRFKIAGGSRGIREHGLAQAASSITAAQQLELDVPDNIGCSHASIGDVIIAAADVGAHLQLVEGFPDIGPNVIRPTEWELTIAQLFTHAATIHVKELTAVVLGVQGLARSASNRASEVLVLCDNMGMVLSVAKGRPADFRTLCSLRKLSALLLASGVRLRCRWIHSEVNPGDFACRWFGSGGTPARGKCLLGFACKSDSSALLADGIGAKGSVAAGCSSGLRRPAPLDEPMRCGLPRFSKAESRCLRGGGSVEGSSRDGTACAESGGGQRVSGQHCFGAAIGRWLEPAEPSSSDSQGTGLSRRAVERRAQLGRRWDIISRKESRNRGHSQGSHQASSGVPSTDGNLLSAEHFAPPPGLGAPGVFRPGVSGRGRQQHWKQVVGRPGILSTRPPGASSGGFPTSSTVGSSGMVSSGAHGSQTPSDVSSHVGDCCGHGALGPARGGPGVGSVCGVLSEAQRGPVVDRRRHHSRNRRNGGVFSCASLVLFPAERGRLSKAQVFNDAVLMDSKHRSWPPKALPKLAKDRINLPLFNYKYHQWAQAFRQAVDLLGLAAWEVTLHAARHCGPSHDCLARLRSLPGIQKRGRWTSETTVRRYEKSARAASKLHDLPKSLQDFCRRCGAMIADTLLRGHKLPALPPRVGVPKGCAKRRRT